MTAAVGDAKQYDAIPVGFFPNGSPMSTSAGLGVLTRPRSMEQARQLVAEAGYKGERIVMPAPSDLPQIMAMSQVVQDQLSHAGLRVELQTMDWGTMLSR